MMDMKDTICTNIRATGPHEQKVGSRCLAYLLDFNLYWFLLLLGTCSQIL
jgi:hypothetical protein